jgi:hypothetical protein
MGNLDPLEKGNLRVVRPKDALALPAKGKRGPRQQFTPEEVEAALVKADGFLYMAARRLHCCRTTIHNYCVRYPDVQEAARQARESVLDEAERQLYTKVRNGDITSIIFFLKTQGKSRGYVERAAALGVQHDLSVLSDAELLALGPILTKLNGPAPTGWAPLPGRTNP